MNLTTQFNERVGGLAVVGGDVRRLVPAEEGADVVKRPNPFGAECHDHAPMICSHSGSCSLRWKPASRSCSLLIALVWRAGTRLAIESEGGRPSPEVLARARADVEHANDLGGAEDEAAAVMFAIRDHLPRPGGAGEPDGVATDAAGVPDSEPDSLQRRYVRESTRLGRRFSQASPLRESYRLVEAGQYDSAAVAFTEIVTNDPSADRAWATLEELHLQQGDYAAAVGVRQDRIYAIQGRTPAAQAEVQALLATFDEDDPATYWQWRHDHNTNRQTQGERVSEVEWATTAVGLGDHGLALRHLEAAIENRDPGLLSLRTSARWDPLRNDPAFQDLSRRARDLWQGGMGIGGRRPERGGERRPR